MQKVDLPVEYALASARLLQEASKMIAAVGRVGIDNITKKQLDAVTDAWEKAQEDMEDTLDTLWDDAEGDDDD